MDEPLTVKETVKDLHDGQMPTWMAWFGEGKPPLKQKVKMFFRNIILYGIESREKYAKRLNLIEYDLHELGSEGPALKKSELLAIFLAKKSVKLLSEPILERMARDLQKMANYRRERT